jgi:hypothetical protein
MPVGISKTVLILCEAFGDGLDASRVGRALARGVEAKGWACDVCALANEERRKPARLAGEQGKLGRIAGERGKLDQIAGERTELDRLDFDRRMREARAVVIAVRELDDRALAGSVAFEAATRARQSGVPVYAVAARDELDPFEARIVDLQVVLQAGSTRALGAAARKLGDLL